jgi:hypothetical protein
MTVEVIGTGSQPGPAHSSPNIYFYDLSLSGIAYCRSRMIRSLSGPPQHSGVVKRFNVNFG